MAEILWAIGGGVTGEAQRAALASEATPEVEPTEPEATPEVEPQKKGRGKNEDS